MSVKEQLSILKQVVNLPTAPFVEGQVVRFIKRFIAQRPQLRLSTDPFGNLLVRYMPKRRSRSRGRPILFSAHMDHPGFTAVRMTGDRRVYAEFRGWVRSPYFKNERVQFYSDGAWVPGRIVEVIPHKPGRTMPRRAAASARSFGADAPPKAIVAEVRRPVRAGSPGMWGLGDAVIRGNRIFARMCDDTAGLAGILCALDAICRKGNPTPCYAFFTRAEEVGFGGTLAAVDRKTVPRDVLVVGVECSKAIEGVALGAGPILRVGDKATVFTPAATAYCQVVAEQLAAKDKAFAFQRKLMDGGTCESTAYCHYGYDATGICLPLGNYHNMDESRDRIGPEFIDVRDFANLVKWFVALAASPMKLRYDGRHPGLDKRLDSLLRQHRGRLLRTARTIGS